MRPPAPSSRSGALRLNIGLLRFTRNWLKIALIAIGLYAALPILTPIFMRVGLTDVGRALYTIYSPFCHQFAFRSLFLFGEQPAYPRTITGTSQTPFEPLVVNDPVFLQSYRNWYGQFNDGADPGAITLDTLNTFTPWFQFAARDFVGNAQLGYKMALCARDVAIYSALFIGGVIYSLPAVRRRLRPIPFGLYLVAGVAPIAIDGFSQLLGYPPFNLWPPRETLPIFRVITGAIFGLMSAWLVFPNLELSMRDAREAVEEKLLRANIVV